MAYVLIIGPESSLTKAVMSKYAENGYNIYLAGTVLEDLNSEAKDLEKRYGVNVKTFKFDILEFYNNRAFYNSLDPKPIGVICIPGYTGSQQRAEKSFVEAKLIIDSNYVGFASILNVIAADFEEKKEGFIVGVCSVEGERGKQSNYVYGSTQAAFNVYLSGLRNRLTKSKIKVLTVKTGLDSNSLAKSTNMPARFAIEYTNMADEIFKAQQQGKDIIYIKWYLRCITIAINAIPEFIFKRLKF